jgi:hypothetical protein
MASTIGDAWFGVVELVGSWSEPRWVMFQHPTHPTGHGTIVLREGARGPKENG